MRELKKKDFEVVGCEIEEKEIMREKFDYFEPVKEKNLRPNSIHYFGTTDEGRDIFAGVWQGARSSLGISFIIAFLNLSIGIVYGGICSFYVVLLMT